MAQNFVVLKTLPGLANGACSALDGMEIPNLVGITEDAAKAKLEGARLSYGSSVGQASEFDAGIVIGQMPEAFTQIEEHAKITLIVSTGPGEP